MSAWCAEWILEGSESAGWLLLIWSGEVDGDLAATDSNGAWMVRIAEYV